MILCKKAILVEGDSDELIIQRAYLDSHEGKLPIEDGVEVISVGTSFLRFLEIAECLEIPVKVVTDNDGDIEVLEKKYEKYIGKSKKYNIEICYDGNKYEGDLKLGKDEKPFNYNTLEPLFLKENGIKTFNAIFKTEYSTENQMHKHMRKNKTDCALKIFSYENKIKYPDYIMRAVL